MTTTELFFYLLLVVFVLIFFGWLTVYTDRKESGDFEIVSNELNNEGEIETRRRDEYTGEKKIVQWETWFIRKITYKSGRVEYKKTVIKR